MFLDGNNADFAPSGDVHRNHSLQDLRQTVDYSENQTKLSNFREAAVAKKQQPGSLLSKFVTSVLKWVHPSIKLAANSICHPMRHLSRLQREITIFDQFSRLSFAVSCVAQRVDNTQECSHASGGGFTASVSCGTLNESCGIKSCRCLVAKMSCAESIAISNGLLLRDPLPFRT